MPETPASIHAFWFGQQTDDSLLAQERAELWWKKNAQTDEQIRQRFATSLASLERRELDDWADTPAGRLALILIADQFSRHIHRDTPHAFRLDPLAQGWSREGIAAGMDHALRPIERVFFYLPLEHSESLRDQEEAVALFTHLAEIVPAPQRTVFDGFLRYAIRHRDIVARFGRFPHRNNILGRSSSDAEIAFLKQPGSGF